MNVIHVQPLGCGGLAGEGGEGYRLGEYVL